MKKRILLFTAIAGFGYFILSSYVTGPGANGYDCSGADANSSSGNPTGCSTGSGCHSTSATAGITVVVEIDSAGVTTSTTASGTGHYTPGYTYTIKITGTNTTTNTLPRFGFQVAATVGATAAAVPVNAGTLQSTGLPTNVHYVNAPRTSTSFYASVVEHDAVLTPASGTGGTGTTYVESFTWTAPVSGTGTVSLFGAVNAVNNNDLADAGDLWNTTHLVLNELTSTTSVATVSNNINIKTYPNPATTNLNVQMDNAEEGTYALRVFDINGRMVHNENISVNSNNHTSTINTGNWGAGTYQLMLQKDGFSKTISVVKK